MATKESTIDKGGFVENVANVAPEPDEKKVRGMPFTYAELGGVLAQDVEDRRGFASGNEVLEQYDTRAAAEDQGLIERVPLSKAAAYAYGLVTPVVGGIKAIDKRVLSTQLNNLRGSNLDPISKDERDRLGFAEGAVVFDPEGDGYDYTTAEKYGLGPDESGHYPSRVPETGQLLKAINHPTFHLTEQAEEKLGNIIFKGKDGFYYSLSKDEMDRLGLAKGGWFSKRRAARQQELYDKGYSRFMNWAVDRFTPFGLLGGISNLSNVDADRFPRLYNIGVQTGKVYDIGGGALKGWLTRRKGESRYDERGLLKDPSSYETNYDELVSQMQALNPSFEKQDTGGLFGGIGRKGRQARRAARQAARKEEGGWLDKIRARREEQGGLLSRISGEITDDTRYAMRDRNTMLSNLAARAGPQNPYTLGSVKDAKGNRVGTYFQRHGGRGDEEREANIREAKAAHRRVNYAEGGESLLGRTGFAEGKGVVPQVISDKELADHTELLFNKYLIGTPSMSSHKLLIDTIWQMESDQGKNKKTKLGGPYQMFAGTQSDALNLAGGLRAKHSDDKGSNFSKEQIDYLENTSPNEMQDNATRLLMTQIFFSRAVKADDWTKDNLNYNIGEGTKLLQEYHENPTWEKAEEIYFKLWIYGKKEDYAKETATVDNPKGDDIGPNLIKGEKYFNKHLKDSQNIAPESWYPGKIIKDMTPAHAEVYLTKVLFGDRDPITERVFSADEYERVTGGIKENILASLIKARDSRVHSDTFFDTQGRLRNRVSQDAYGGNVYGVEKNIGSFEPHFAFSGRLSRGLPYELKTILGSARFNLKKGDYNTEKLTIDSDRYNFSEYYTGLETEPGLNIANLRQYYELAQLGQWRNVAERFANRRLPDEDTVNRWKEEYGLDREAEYAPVNMSFPVADIFSEYEWAILQRREGEEPPVRVANLKQQPISKVKWLENKSNEMDLKTSLLNKKDVEAKPYAWGKQASLLNP